MAGIFFTTSINGLHVVLVDVLLSCYDVLKEISERCSKGKQYEVSSVDKKNSGGQNFVCLFLIMVKKTWKQT